VQVVADGIGFETTMAMKRARLGFGVGATAVAVATAVTACSGTEGDVLRTPSGAAPALAVRPRPTIGATYQIQLSVSGAPDTTIDAGVYTLDLATQPSVIADLHAAGRIVMCYFSGGTYEPFRSDAAGFPAAALGTALADYPDERWLDVRDAQVHAIMQARVGIAAASGCDGIHPSNLDGYLQTTGFQLTESDQIAYDRWMAGQAHALGLSAGLVDGDEALTGPLAADFDWAVVWSCVDAGCAAASPFVAVGKPVFVVEFGDSSLAANVCPKASALGLSAVIKNQSLDAFRGGCP
jgi:hypothetical protein